MAQLFVYALCHLIVKFVFQSDNSELKMETSLWILVMFWCFGNIVDGWCTRGLSVLILCLSVRVVLPLCGGNIDTTVLGRCLDRGLACDGRLLKFSVTVSDRPGGIAELCRHMASIGISIKDIMHERAWIQSDIFSVEVNGHISASIIDKHQHMHFFTFRTVLV